MKIINSQIFDKPSCKFKYLASEGFNVPNYYEINSTDEITKLYKEYIANKRNELNYDIDGLVEEVDDYEIQEKLGYEPNGLNPKFATAIKFDSISQISIFENVEWNVGMTGKIIPVGIFKPVDIMGVKISRATLHNIDNIYKLVDEGLNIGAKVIISRQGDVIPQILGIKEKNPNGQDIEIPKYCPKCNSELKKISVDLICENEECPAKIVGLFTNFLNVLEIKGVSEKFIEKAIKLYKIKSIKDLMNLTIDDIKKMDGFADKSANNAYSLLHSKNEISKAQFLALLNIPNLNIKVFENILSQFEFEKLLDENTKIEDLTKIKGVAEKTAKMILDGISKNKKTIEENKKIFTLINDTITNNLNGLSFCITGKLNKSRKIYENEIKKQGGKIISPSKNLNYLVTNDFNANSSKLNKVKELNKKNETDIKIISEKELNSILYKGEKK
jgi:DNA ligase (NAD+)